MDHLPQRAPSPRLTLAALARDTALAVPGVAALDSGTAGTFVTVAGGGAPVGGVRCLAAPDGGFDLELRLVCELVELRALGDDVRASVERAAAADGFRVSTVSVTIADVTVA